MKRLLPLLLLFLFSSSAQAVFIAADTTWSGVVEVTEDVLIPPGVTLTVEAGTRVIVTPSDSTKTDPEFLSPLTEITVRGALVVQGERSNPVVFSPAGDKAYSWAGIIVDGGTATVRSAEVVNAETAVSILGGRLLLAGTLLAGNRHGLVVYGRDAVVAVEQATVRDNDYGVMLFDGGTLQQKDSAIRGNRKKDRYSASARDPQPRLREYMPHPQQTTRIYHDEALLGVTVWRGRVEVQGTVRVPENSRLIVTPGTVVEFRRKDTNRDGIGENGLLIQGTIIAKGTGDNPIVFRSAEQVRRMGDWDGINIMNSDTAQNLVEFCEIEDAYRGLHFHFSNVTVADSVVRNNYRGIQFQESVVTVRGTHIYGNRSGLQARDSDIVFTDNIVYRNFTGVNMLRNSIVLTGNVIMQNRQDGLRLREGIPVVERNLIDGNRHGMMITDSFFGAYTANAVSHNLEYGIALRGTSGIDIAGNVIQGNGINGINIQEAGASIHGNLITDNAERGIGVVSFQGNITGNNITGNGLYNLGIDGRGDVAVTRNWWGAGNVPSTIFDKTNDPTKGRAEYLPMLEGPVLIAWPLQVIRADATWRGEMAVSGTVTVGRDIGLTIAPGTRVLFSKGAGLAVHGRITARGDGTAPIVFTSADGGGAGTWGEIVLDHAVGSVFSGCSFSGATWALHSHFTDLVVDGCSFVHNEGGLRFTSGPVEVRHSLFSENGIGLRAFRGTALVSENEFTGNAVGIFVREKGSGLTITKNNLFANTDFNVRIGDFNDEDVSARNNWWGTAQPADTIYDARKEPGIGTVLFEPAAEGPFRIPLPPFAASSLKDQEGLSQP